MTWRKMGDSVLERMMGKAVDELLNDLKWALALVKTLQDVNNNLYPIEVVTIRWIRQTWIHRQSRYAKSDYAIGKIPGFQRVADL